MGLHHPQQEYKGSHKPEPDVGMWINPPAEAAATIIIINSSSQKIEPFQPKFTTPIYINKNMITTVFVKVEKNQEIYCRIIESG